MIAIPSRTILFSANSATLAFNGEGVTVSYYKNTGYGTMTVRIDGADIGTIDMSGSGITVGYTWTSAALIYGDHTLTLVHSAGSTIDLDAITVTGP